MRKIFISHSSKDKFYVDLLVKFLKAMQIPAEGIYCTSAEGYGIAPGETIFEDIRKQFREHELFALMIFSDDYFRSVPCLNEMGAIYISECPYELFFVPGFEYTSMIGGMIDFREAIQLQGSVTLLESNLKNLVEKLYRFMGLNYTVPSVEIYAEYIFNQIQENLKNPDEVWLQIHKNYQVRGKWLHIHLKPNIRVGEVSIEQKKETITSAIGRNVTPFEFGLNIKENTSWHYSIGVIKEINGQHYLNACYSASNNKSDANEGLHLTRLLTDQEGVPVRMEGTFSDVIDQNHPEKYVEGRINNHAGQIIFFRMSKKVEEYLNANDIDRDYALAQLHLIPEFSDEPFVKFLLEERKRRKMEQSR